MANASSPREAKIADENIDYANRAVFGDMVIKTFGKQGGLTAILALGESAHRLLPSWKA